MEKPTWNFHKRDGKGRKSKGLTVGLTAGSPVLVQRRQRRTFRPANFVRMTKCKAFASRSYKPFRDHRRNPICLFRLLKISGFSGCSDLIKAAYETFSHPHNETKDSLFHRALHTLIDFCSRVFWLNLPTS